MLFNIFSSLQQHIQRLYLNSARTYSREDVQICTRQCRGNVVPIVVIQCQESTIPTLLFFNNPYFTMIRLILLTQAKTTNPCSGLPLRAAVAMQYGHPLKTISASYSENVRVFYLFIYLLKYVVHQQNA